MRVLEKDFEKEQKDYYLLSSRWAELNPNALLAEPVVIKEFDMITCTLQEARGIFAHDEKSSFEFHIVMDENLQQSGFHVISGLAGWFTADFKSRTDEGGILAPEVAHPSFLSTGPENGYTHWGQQVFHFISSIPLIKGEITTLSGSIELMRTSHNSRLYNCRLRYESTRSKKEEGNKSSILMKAPMIDLVFMMP
jgi:protein arginine N-methyltransferase 1